MFVLDQSEAGAYHVAQLRAEARRAGAARSAARSAGRPGLLGRLRAARTRA